jgi:hypothetical protein
MPKTTVTDYLARAAAAGVRYADVAGMSEEAVEALLFQRAELPEQRPMPDWEWVAAELGKRGVTLMLVWEEYRQQHRNGYSYSQFRRHFLDHTSASAEKGVQVVETRVLAALRNRVFFTLDEANAAIRELVAAVNARPLTTNRTLTRRRLFEEQEKLLLKPLPTEPFVIGRWSRYKLAPDYHVSIEGVAYSVPYRLIGRHVDVFCTVSLVSIFHKGQRVAAHARQEAEPGRATVTLDEHRPPTHRAAALLTPDAIRAEAASLGGALGLLADRIFADADHPDQAARQVAGLLRLGRLHGTVALQAAATAALSANVRSYRFVQHLLIKGRIEAVEDAAGGLGPHANLRGAAYYH